MYMYLGTGPAAQVPDQRGAAGDRRFLLHDQEPVRGVQVLPTVSGQGASHHCPAIRRHRALRSLVTMIHLGVALRLVCLFFLSLSVSRDPLAHLYFSLDTFTTLMYFSLAYHLFLSQILALSLSHTLPCPQRTLSNLCCYYIL